MAYIYECRGCGKQISGNARTCPQCGHRGTSMTSIVIASVVGIIGFCAIISSQRAPLGADAAATQPVVQRSTMIENMKKSGHTKAAKLCEAHQDWKVLVCENVASKKVSIGMTPEQIRSAWGKPQSVNRTVFSGHVSEQWVYGDPGEGATYLYVEDGEMTSFQDSK